MMKKRGQISTEYLIVVGFVGFLVLSVLGIAYYYTNSIRDQIRMNQLQSFGNKIITSAESVYYSGVPSRSTINAYLPDGVSSIIVADREIIFSISTSTGINTLSFRSNVKLRLIGQISMGEGSKRIQMDALEDEVTLTQENS